MNFKKLLIVIAVAVVLIGGWKYFTAVDRSNPVAVATAFTKALKGKDTTTASKFYAPDQADAWQVKTDEKVGGMRSGARERFYEGFPDSPEFGQPVTAAGKTTILSGDKLFSLQMTQIDGKWYVTNSEF